MQEQETNTSPTPVIETAPAEIKNLFVPERLDGESFDEYQMRRYMAKQRLKQMSKGKLFWNSRPEVGKKGVTYRKSEVTA
jgi:hypothetical protein